EPRTACDAGARPMSESRRRSDTPDTRRSQRWRHIPRARTVRARATAVATWRRRSGRDPEVATVGRLRCPASVKPRPDVASGGILTPCARAAPTIYRVDAHTNGGRVPHRSGAHSNGKGNTRAVLVPHRKFLMSNADICAQLHHLCRRP